MLRELDSVEDGKSVTDVWEDVSVTEKVLVSN